MLQKQNSLGTNKNNSLVHPVKVGSVFPPVPGILVANLSYCTICEFDNRTLIDFFKNGPINNCK